MNVLSAYDSLVAAGELKPDPEQAAAARRLAALRAQLVAQAKPGLLTRLLGKAPAAPRGIYMWGGVGRGKSMLMTCSTIASQSPKSAGSTSTSS